MKFGDFSHLAGDYALTRPGYSSEVLSKVFVQADLQSLTFADVGAGTGIFTRQVRDFGLTKVFGVEPNSEMRTQGINHIENRDIVWIDGSAESTKLDNFSIDVLSMASSFHWANTSEALSEFRRVIKPGGKFLALWNPRKISGSNIDFEVENVLKTLIPKYVRKSSGYSPFCENLLKTLNSSKIFAHVEYVEFEASRIISSDNYLKLWKSVNDVQVQLGELTFNKFMTQVASLLNNVDHVEVSNVTRAWISTLKS
jgi:ubiquinone/menaquinone biosynthesis C-methylase UbiE